MKKNEKISNAKSADTAKKRKKAESPREASLETLRKTEELYTKLVDTIPDSIIRTDLEGNILFVNDYTLKMSGYSREEVEGQNILKFVAPEEHEYMIQNILLLLENGLGPREYKLIMKDGNKIPFEIHAEVLRNEDRTPFGLVSVCRDISERKRTEGILRENEELLRGITQNLPGIIFQFYAKDSGEYGVNYFSEPLGEFSEIIENIDTTNPDTLFTSFLSRIYEEDKDRFLQSIMTAVEIGTSWSFEGRVATMSGKIIWIHGLSTPTRHENQLVFDGILLNITDRKKAEEDLHKSEESFRNYLEYAPDGVYMSDVKGNFLYGNRKSEEIIGYKREDLIGKNFLELNLLTEKGLNKAVQWLQSNIEGKPTGPDEIELINKEGRIIPVEIHTSVVQRTGQEIVLAFVRDITERKKAEEELRESEYKYKSLINNISDIIFTIDLEGKITFASKRAKEKFGYDDAETINKHFFNFIPEENRQEAVEKMLKGMKGEKIKHVQTPVIAKSGEKFIFDFSFSRIYKDGRVVGAQGTAVDITERKKAEEKLQQTLKSLRKAVGTTIQVLVSAVESRDPYTSGHQSRSADLACAIATEMGLDPEKIEGIRMAGIIHDIGKLSIPAEILSKPTKLTEIEFALIKEHARSGYEMLKDVESPWPLSEIVYQHHERINGSGYPRNLKGDEIIIESQILAVADVVEAMASHRPYRPTLGIEAALEEIEKNKGILYDNTVVDSCLKLFREKGFHLT